MRLSREDDYADALEKLFHRLSAVIEQAGFVAMWSKLGMPLLWGVPKQGNTWREKAEIKAEYFPQA